MEKKTIKHQSCLLPMLLESSACVFSCQQGRYLVIAKDFSPIAFAAIKDKVLRQCSSSTSHIARTSHLPFTTGYLGLISYDAFAQANNPAPLLFWRIDGAVVYDNLENNIWLTGTCSADDLLVAQEPQASATQGYRASDLSLLPENSDADYLACVQQIINDIRAGRYYLLNYLRFFALKSKFNLHEVFTRKVISSTSPYKALLRWDDQAIYAFSPEQFIAFNPALGQLLCSPIKGTAARKPSHLDMAQALLHSAKDLAELHITIDLVRNDIGVIADAVRVKNSGQVRSFSTVHHLVATIQATLARQTTLADLLNAMCPAASISGAPKIEVMKAISEYEVQPRGYFMGNLICLDDSGWLDSSVLIRTVYSKGNRFTYAAGGGITLASEPKRELQEVMLKTRVLR